ncbi:hypothetical protein HPB47_023951 [Ixodes persulcatus]|uniref:Uncharacterized protein n=1 Tax=Ixodes persulcatus TaxID=34615 RepID=A0AC60Q5L9_IXOPE|nr:hypothetical protein HPB47_023951 [Ixodes persulcatus]
MMPSGRRLRRIVRLLDASEAGRTKRRKEQGGTAAVIHRLRTHSAMILPFVLLPLSLPISAGASTLRPIRPSVADGLHVAAATGRPVDPQWVDLFSFLLLHLPASVPFKTVTVTSTVYADASGTGLGLCLPDGNVAVLTSSPRGIYRRELWAVLLAVLLSPPRTLVLSDNQAVVAALTHGHGQTFNVCEALAATILFCNKDSWVAWLPTDSNLADAPSRLNRTLFRGHERRRR